MRLAETLGARETAAPEISLGDVIARKQRGCAPTLDPRFWHSVRVSKDGRKEMSWLQRCSSIWRPAWRMLSV